MSWHYSRALVAAYSADTCSAGAPSAPLSGSDTRETFCSHGKTTDACRPFRSGTTCKPLTEDLGEALLTWFRADSLAKTSAQPARAQESTESAAECGRTWPESFARWDRDTASWKTPQCSLLAGLDEFSETWPRWGMMRDGECWAQSMPAHRISETEFGFAQNWPTPQARDWKGSSGRSIKGEEFDLPTAVRTWPTPTVCGNYNRKGLSPTSGDGLATAVKMWATPQASDNRDRCNLSNPSIQRRIDLGKQINLSMQVKEASDGGSLNPTWVEWLMGWPLGWTDLKPLETDKFPAWQHSHGSY